MLIKKIKQLFLSDEKPLVSVLMPAYNHGKYVAEALSSVIKQTYNNIEIIVINDGSEDDTWHQINLLKKYCEKRFVKTIIINNQHEGIIKTANELVFNSCGKYLFAMASDDIMNPQTVSTLVKFLENNHLHGLVCGDNEIINEDSKRVFLDKELKMVSRQKAEIKTFGQYLRYARKDVDFYSDEFGSYETLLKGNYIPGGRLYLREAVVSAGPLTEEAPLDDWYINLQVSKKYKIKFMDKILYSYRWHENNSFKNTEKMQEIGKKTLLYETKSHENKSINQ